MMNELAQAGIFFGGSAAGKGAARAQAAPGLAAEERAHPYERAFQAIFRESCQRQKEGKNSPGRIRSLRSPEPGEESAEPEADRKEGDVNGLLAFPCFLLPGSQAGEAAVADGTVNSGRTGDAGYGPVSFRSGPATAEAGFTGFPGFTEINAGAPVETESWREPVTTITSPEIPAAAGETEPVPGETNRPAVVVTTNGTGGSTGITIPGADEELPAGAEFALEKEREEASATVPGRNESGGGRENPVGFENLAAAKKLPLEAVVSGQAEAGKAKAEPVAGRREQKDDPHLPAGEKRAPAFSLEQLEVENGEEKPVFSVPGREKTAGTFRKKEEPEFLAAGRLPADQPRTDSLSTVEEPGGSQGARSPLMEKVMNQILQGARVMVKDGVAHMHLKLEPPALGKIQLALVVEGELVTARFTAESQTVQALIETNLPELRSALQEAGLQVDLLQVEVQTGGSQGDTFDQFLPEQPAPGADRLEMAFFNAAGDEEGIREEAAWLGLVNLRV